MACLAHGSTPLKLAEVTCGKGFIGVAHPYPLGCPWGQGQCIGPAVGKDRSIWCSHVAPWVPEPQQERQNVAQGWLRSGTVGQRTPPGQASPPSCQGSPSHPILSTMLLPSQGIFFRPYTASAYTYIWENCQAPSTWQLLGRGLATEQWQGKNRDAKCNIQLLGSS